MVEMLLRIAREHGFRAESNLSGGVNVYIPFSSDVGNGIEVFACHDLRSLKIALGY